MQARRVQGKGDDSVVGSGRSSRPSFQAGPKLAELRRRSRRDAGRLRLLGHDETGLGQPIVRETLSGKRPLRKLFSKEQRAFFTERDPEGSLDDLAVLGPIFVLKLKWAPKTSHASLSPSSVLPQRQAHPGAVDEVRAG